MTIVVPTRDRPEDLRVSLAALRDQTLNDRAEIVVVDDGSGDEAAVAEAVAGVPAARLLRQAPAGPAAARNAGVRVARADVVCFTDDDCHPERHWAARLLEGIRSGADAVGGRTVSSDARATLRAAELIAQAPSRAKDGAVLFAPSNNLACRADVLAGLPFDERYPTAAGEDREWCAQLLERAFVLKYEPTAIVVHRPRPDLASFIRQQVRYGRGAFAFRRLGEQPRPLERPGFYAALVRRGFDEGLTTGLLVCLAQMATAAGFALEWLARRGRSNQRG